ncbi:hypothetical protein FTUN_6788 [Frigoriglobus tundricola]|uniref:Uncharacterized protein n=1 Tax=Frigoriglobus tundricola TaxID=2774151 RepID=A0A6M5YZA1_9BACT|nr:hypothetical protein FTUN_6788 [Frigoriglobus tundricola]
MGGSLSVPEPFRLLRVAKRLLTRLEDSPPSPLARESKTKHH